MKRLLNKILDWICPVKPFATRLVPHTPDSLVIEYRREGRCTSWIQAQRYYNPFFRKTDNPHDSTYWYPIYVSYDKALQTKKELERITSYEEFHQKYQKNDFEKFLHDLDEHNKWCIERKNILKNIL